LRLPRSIRKSVARKLLFAVGVPSALVALAALAWLRAETRAVSPTLWAEIAAGAVAIALGSIAVHFVAVNVLVKKPLRALAAAMRRAREGEWLARVPVRGEDEVAQLSESFNATLKAITDLHVLRTDDQLAMASMQRELALKAELQEQHRLLDAANRQLEGRLRALAALADLSHALAATLDPDALCRAVSEAVGRRLGFTAFAMFVLDEEAGDLVVKSAFGVDGRAEGSRLAIGDGAAGVAARDKRVVLVRDVGADPRTSVRTWLPPGAGSLVAAPLLHQGELLGVLDFWRDQPDAFSEEDLRFLGSVADQAAIAVSNARLHQRTVALSLTDALTGVLNRRGLAERLRLEHDRADRFGTAFALAVVDVDRLKSILEGHGLVAGDALLRSLAQVLAGELRRVDALARYRGDKFAVVLPRADRHAALEVAEKLRAAVERAAFEALPRGPGGVTVSVGLASFPEDARDLDGLVDAADAALFAAKRAGRNAVRAHAAGMREDPARPQAGRVTAGAGPGA
jgi:diguanylate cyclase (GGDEF)-like protein